MAADDYSDKDAKEDIKVLHGMGYAQELSRSMSKFSNFAISGWVAVRCLKALAGFLLLLTSGM